MAKVGQIAYRVPDKATNGYYTSPSGIGIYGNVLTSFGNSANKIGVQAPPGTRLILNDTKEIMVGRTGIYELDEDIEITSLKFVQPLSYIRDDQASETKKNSGISAMTKANTDRTNAMNALDTRYKGKTKDESYYSEYNSIQNTYVEAYQQGYTDYMIGVNGVYKETDQKRDLENIIIDFLY